MRTKTPRVFALITAGTLCIMLVSGFAIVYAANPPSGNVVPNFSALNVAGNTTIGGACTVNGLTATGNATFTGTTLINNASGLRVSSGTSADDLTIKGGNADSLHASLITALKTLVLEAGGGSANWVSPDVGTVVLGGGTDKLALLGNGYGWASVTVDPATHKSTIELRADTIKTIGDIVNPLISSGVAMPVKIDDPEGLNVTNGIDIQGSIKNSEPGDKPIKIDNDLNLLGAIRTLNNWDTYPVIVDDILQVNKDIDARGVVKNLDPTDKPVKIDDGLTITGVIDAQNTIKNTTGVNPNDGKVTVDDPLDVTGTVRAQNLNLSTDLTSNLFDGIIHAGLGYFSASVGTNGSIFMKNEDMAGHPDSDNVYITNTTEKYASGSLVNIPTTVFDDLYVRHNTAQKADGNIMLDGSLTTGVDKILYRNNENVGAGPGDPLTFTTPYIDTDVYPNTAILGTTGSHSGSTTNCGPNAIIMSCGYEHADGKVLVFKLKPVNNTCEYNVYATAKDQNISFTTVCLRK
ncbi:MAG: hypothetical protein UT33_C0008G0011 [Candidatus Peregrinibacteria bacterium GW2011_GWC2_39_14]|nr:MAG: hypothetical protein US92_C0004G0011 [Candidatus Peregrinibacteria bacterium GW2011_GWA2_38_36]KKR06695.1 MAG: hypothetical protein UT33_C0008G0011 [Candidatus Peregrinibacteria bacterium GW2011_GWC2_39_14]